jgi:hypothetical protein
MYQGNHFDADEGLLTLEFIHAANTRASGQSSLMAPGFSS